MPAVSERQRRFMGMEYGKAKRGEATDVNMSKKQLREFATKRKKHKRKASRHARRKTRRRR